MASVLDSAAITGSLLNHARRSRAAEKASSVEVRSSAVDMGLASSWVQGAGACHMEMEVLPSWKGCSLSDWQIGATTCYVETWRAGSAPAERDVAQGSQVLAPGSAPAVERSSTLKKAPKTRRRNRVRGDSNPRTASDTNTRLPSVPLKALLAPGIPGVVPRLEDVLARGMPGVEWGAVSLDLDEKMGEVKREMKGEAKVGLKEEVNAKAGISEKGGGWEVGGEKRMTQVKEEEEEKDDGISHFDFVVIGSGIAGLRFALDVAEKGTVAVITKSERQEGSTNYAQGGVSAVLDPKDSVENHIRDTIVAGAYLNDEEVVEVVCREGPDRVRELMEMGASFDKGEDGRLQLAREGGHSHNRIVHAADVTGREIQRALLVAAQRNSNITLFEHHFVVDLLTVQDAEGVYTCYGVDALDVRSGKVLRFFAGSTLLASGGAGHVYPSTTNPSVATGDGIALAQRAEAVISNMEFVQFHPTALADAGLPNPPSTPRPNAFLVTEAVRGAGGILYNQSGERFILEYDLRAELAPRDVVARSIDDQLKQRGEQFVWLDISHLPKEEILSHFPNIAEECRRCGIDITKEPVPVVPAAHYMCGGVQTGLHGETSVKGLWAAGEVACTGLHGANRLASNSLLEALVFAQRAVGPAMDHALMCREHGPLAAGGSEGEEESALQRELLCLLKSAPRVEGVAEGDKRAAAAADVTSEYRSRLQDTMWDYVGIVRSTERLLVAQRQLLRIATEWKKELAGIPGLPSGAVSVAVCEMRNLLTVAMLIVQSALQRQESRGLHFTTDFPEALESERLPTLLLPDSIAQAWSPKSGGSPKELPRIAGRKNSARNLAGSRVQAVKPQDGPASPKKRLP